MKNLTCLTSVMLFFFTAHPCVAAENISAIKIHAYGLIKDTGYLHVYEDGENCTGGSGFPLFKLKTKKIPLEIGVSSTFVIDIPWKVKEKVSEKEETLTICRNIVSIVPKVDEYNFRVIAKDETCEIEVNDYRMDELPDSMKDDIKLRKQLPQPTNGGYGKVAACESTSIIAPVKSPEITP